MEDPFCLDAISLEGLQLPDLEQLLGDDPTSPPAANGGLAGANGASSRRGRDVALMSEQARARVLQEREKNRRAAAKYREKKKEQQQALEAQHQAAEEDLQRTRQQHAALQHQNRVLEGLLAVRDSSLAVLERAKAEDSQPASPASHGSQACGAACSSGTLHMAASGSSGNMQVGRERGGAAATEAEAAAECDCGGLAAMLLKRSVSGRSAASSSADGGGDSSSCSGSPHGRAPGAGRAWRLPPITYHHGWDEEGNTDLRELCETADSAVVAQVRSCTPEDFVRGWREFARTARDLLQEYDVTGNEELLRRRLRPLMEERSLLMSLMVHYNPTCIWHLFAASADGLSEEQQREKWDAVVAAMQMTPEEHRRKLQLCAEYERIVQQIRSERAEAVSALGQASASCTVATGGLNEMVARYLQVVEGAGSLSALQERQLLALLELLSGMGRSNRPLQRARAAAMAHPSFPDILGIMAAIKRLPPPP